MQSDIQNLAMLSRVHETFQCKRRKKADAGANLLYAGRLELVDHLSETI